MKLCVRVWAPSSDHNERFFFFPSSSMFVPVPYICFVFFSWLLVFFYFFFFFSSTSIRCLGVAVHFSWRDSRDENCWWMPIAVVGCHRHTHHFWCYVWSQRHVWHIIDLADYDAMMWFQTDMCINIWWNAMLSLIDYYFWLVKEVGWFGSSSYRKCLRDFISFPIFLWMSILLVFSHAPLILQLEWSESESS